MGTPLGAGRRLSCGEWVTVRLDTPRSLAEAGIAAPTTPPEVGPGLLALVWVAPGALMVSDGEPRLPELTLEVGGRRRPGTTVVAAGPAPDGRAVAWVHLPVDAGARGLDGGGAALHLTRVDARGDPPARVPVPAELMAELLEELAGPAPDGRAWDARRAPA